MARIKQLKKIQKEVNKIIRSLNKELKEDCFAGRFKILQSLRIDHHIEDDYYTSIYRFTFIDKEHPERNVDKWIDTYSMFSFKYELLTFANDCIVESDFWNLWHNDQEYRNNHWYSGKQKEEAEKYGISKELRK